MDTKLKNNRKKRIWITTVALVLITAVNFVFFAHYSSQYKGKEESVVHEYNDIYEGNINLLYHNCYCLYLQQHQQSDRSIEAGSVFMSATKEEYSDLYNGIESTLESWERESKSNLMNVDYYMQRGDSSTKNTDKMLEELLEEQPDSAIIEDLKKSYEFYFLLRFDENGVLSIQVENSGDLQKDLLIKAFLQADRDSALENYISERTLESVYQPITDFTVIYGIPYDINLPLYDDGMQWDNRLDSDSEPGLFYLGTLAVIAVLALFMNSKLLWRDITSYDKHGKWQIAEAAVIYLLCFEAIFFEYRKLMAAFIEYGITSYRTLLITGETATGHTSEVWGFLVTQFVYWFIWFACFYLAMSIIRPVFSLGLGEYIRQYSLIYQIYPFSKNLWKRFKASITDIDLSEGVTRNIFKIVLLNLVAFVVCSWFDMFGVYLFVVYSVVLFYNIKKNADKIRGDYKTLLSATNRIADGDLEVSIAEDIGVFEPMKDEIAKIQTGFKKAVEEEVKSQRMKAELITNVSHDLKTPLTAITTYVELLKNENLTEEERRSYIDTLDKKSIRLKVLIEDLFEVSKATTNNITLNLMDLDVVKLMKQVAIEHSDGFEKQGIELRWNNEATQTVLKLDNQKTYRVFENLFVNIKKYAMPNSRVYIDVQNKEDMLEIQMKNISAAELNVKGDELTERFVRGDASRNTEGSGLGLAIAKSFVEAQNGKFKIDVDGDLFKVSILWKNLKFR
ncbi:MAG: sensor histidine kinase [Lachnospiraceae bacterium]|nr:sensor histidine kinase [Lachnospiraceae bacterium]